MECGLHGRHCSKKFTSVTHLSLAMAQEVGPASALFHIRFSDLRIRQPHSRAKIPPPRPRQKSSTHGRLLLSTDIQHTHTARAFHPTLARLPWKSQNFNYDIGPKAYDLLSPLSWGEYFCSRMLRQFFAFASEALRHPLEEIVPRSSCNANKCPPHIKGE